MDLIRRLIAVRQDRGLTQDDVAARLGRSQSVVSDFERLGGDPHLSSVYRYATAVGASVDWMVTQIDDLHEQTTMPHRVVSPLLSVTAAGPHVPAAARISWFASPREVIPGAPAAAGT
jgi:transcriptional regulator with XRE-family HTH domain